MVKVSPSCRSAAKAPPRESWRRHPLPGQASGGRRGIRVRVVVRALEQRPLCHAAKHQVPVRQRERERGVPVQRSLLLKPVRGELDRTPTQHGTGPLHVPPCHERAVVPRIEALTARHHSSKSIRMPSSLRGRGRGPRAWWRARRRCARARSRRGAARWGRACSTSSAGSSNGAAAAPCVMRTIAVSTSAATRPSMVFPSRDCHYQNRVIPGIG
jgi:hypothetical protein